MQGASPLHAAVAGWNPPSPKADFEEHLVGLLDEGSSDFRERMVSFYTSCHILTSPVKQRCLLLALVVLAQCDASSTIALCPTAYAKSCHLFWTPLTGLLHG